MRIRNTQATTLKTNKAYSRNSYYSKTRVRNKRKRKKKLNNTANYYPGHQHNGGLVKRLEKVRRHRMWINYEYACQVGIESSFLLFLLKNLLVLLLIKCRRVATYAHLNW